MTYAYYLNVVKTCYVLLLQFKIVLIGIWHTLLIEELILKGGDRTSVITWPVTRISAIARALLYIWGWQMMLLKFSVHTHFTGYTVSIKNTSEERFTVRKCDGICWCHVGRRDISLTAELILEKLLWCNYLQVHHRYCQNRLRIVIITIKLPYRQRSAVMNLPIHLNNFLVLIQ
jgi:hypothetical protein